MKHSTTDNAITGNEKLRALHLIPSKRSFYDLIYSPDFDLEVLLKRLQECGETIAFLPLNFRTDPGRKKRDGDDQPIPAI